MDISTVLPTTELEAVNAMLDSIGEAPIDSLVDIEAPDAGTALRNLRVVGKTVQLAGWSWNTDDDVTIAPNEDGQLVLPANTMKVIPSEHRYGSRITHRGNRLYDAAKQTDIFTTPIKVTLVVALPFEEMPEAARQYVMLLAAERFQEGALGSATLDKFAQDARTLAMQSLQASEAETAGYNVIYDNPTGQHVFYGRMGR